MSKRDSFYDYSDVDSTEDPQEYINYLDTATANTSYRGRPTACCKPSLGTGCST